MIAYRVHNYDVILGQWFVGDVYAFTKLKTAEWYRKKYRRGHGFIIKIYGYDGQLSKDHPNQRTFKKALVLDNLK